MVNNNIRIKETLKLLILKTNLKKASQAYNNIVKDQKLLTNHKT
jgi:hypothetical protein